MQGSSSDQARDSEAVERCLEMLRAYGQGSIISVLSNVERREQGIHGLTSGLDMRELGAVRRMLSIADDAEAARQTLQLEGAEQWYDLLQRALVHPRPPETAMVLCPMVLREADGVSWLLDRIGVGLTGVTISVKYWADLSNPDRIVSNSLERPLEWKGFSSVVDSGGRPLRWASTAMTGVDVTRLGFGGESSARYVVSERHWYLPGIPEGTEGMVLRGDITIDVAGDPRFGWAHSAVTQAELGPFECAIKLPWPQRRIGPHY